MILDEADAQVAPPEGGVPHHPLVEGNAGGHPHDGQLVERARHAPDRRRAVGPPGDQLAQKGIVVATDVEPGTNAAVPAHPRARRHLEHLHPPGGGQEALEGILAGDPALDGVAAQAHILLGEGERFARRHPQLPLDQVDPRDQLGDGVLDLQPGVHLQEMEVAVEVQELHRARADVADRARGPCRGLAHARPQLRRGHRRGRLLHQLLVPPLDRAFALAQMDQVPVSVAQHLHLDVPGRIQITLQIDRRIAEGCLRLAAGGRQRPLQSLRPLHHAHPLAAAPGRRLEQHRKADLASLPARLVRVANRARGTRNPRRARLLHQPAGAHLVAHRGDGVGFRADEHQPGVPHCAREHRPLRQKAISGVHRACPRARRDLEQPVGAKVALARGRWPDPVGFVRREHMGRAAVRLRVHGDAPHAQLPACAHDAQRDLAPVGDQNRFEHRRLLRAECCRVSWTGWRRACSRACRGRRPAGHGSRAGR